MLAECPMESYLLRSAFCDRYNNTFGGWFLGANFFLHAAHSNLLLLALVGWWWWRCKLLFHTCVLGMNLVPFHLCTVPAIYSHLKTYRDNWVVCQQLSLLSLMMWNWKPQTELCLSFTSSSIDKISKVTSPVLVIHGTEDEVIDFSHGLAMYERCPRAVEPLWVEGAGHNDIELYAQYLERLKQFISHELPNSWRSLPDFTSVTVNGRNYLVLHML